MNELVSAFHTESSSIHASMWDNINAIVFRLLVFTQSGASEKSFGGFAPSHLSTRGQKNFLPSAEMRGQAGSVLD